MLLRASQHDLHQRMAWKRSVLAVIVVLNALMSLVAPPLVSHWLVPIDLYDLIWEPGGDMVLAILVLPVGWALIRGKRQAWWLTVASVILSLFSSMLERSHWLSLAFTTIVLLLLLWYAPLFSIRSDPRALLRGYLALGLSAFCLLSTGLFLSLVPHETQIVALLSRHEALIGLHLLAVLFFGYGLFALLQPVQGPRTAPESTERMQARTVLSREGHLSLGHFALSEEKRYFWSATGHSFLAYVVHAGVALVLGEPIGPRAERESLLLAFLQHCQRQDWALALYQAGSTTAHLCRTRGLHPYKIGEEAILDLSSFTLQGKKGAPVRHAMARAKRVHLSIHCWQGETIPEHVFAGMQRVSTQWEQDHQITQHMRFSMGRFPQDWSCDLLTVVACDANGEVQAFLTWMPMYAGAGWALDLMRRRTQAAPGTMEYLIVESLEWARRHGAAHLSLGLAPLAGLSEDTCGSRRCALERGAAWLYQRGLLLGHYRSLRAFKAKFQPDWQERYLSQEAPLFFDRKEIYQMNDTEYITCGDCNGSGCSRCNYKGGFEVCSTPPHDTTTLVWVMCSSCQCAGCKDCNNKGGWYKTLCDLTVVSPLTGGIECKEKRSRVGRTKPWKRRKWPQPGRSAGTKGVRTLDKSGRERSSKTAKQTKECSAPGVKRGQKPSRKPRERCFSGAVSGKRGSWSVWRWWEIARV